jgi:hypothetical protein
MSTAKNVKEQEANPHPTGVEERRHLADLQISIKRRNTMKEEKRTNEQIIHDGYCAVQSVLNVCSDDRKHESQLSEYDLAVLVHHYYRCYLDASDLWFWYGQAGGEWKRESWANNQLNPYVSPVSATASQDLPWLRYNETNEICGNALCDLLGDKANDMIKAAQSEKDAEQRKRLSDEGLKLYEGLVDGTVEMEQWHNYWNRKQLEYRNRKQLE